MKRIYGNTPDNPFSGLSPVACIGMYDGVHSGHQNVITQTIRLARECSAPAVAVTFDIHPRSLFTTPPKMICSLEHRLVLLERLGLDATVILSFNRELAQVKASDFLRGFLVGRLGAQGLIMGERGRFGRNGEGTVEMVNNSGLPIWARKIESVCYNGVPVSSSAIRSAVMRGDLTTAESMLGRRVSVLGTVMPGRQLGRQLGFPTLNIDPHHELHPPGGVYATLSRCGDTYWKSITNIGHRPTIDRVDSGDILIETHLFNYAGNLYNQNVEVAFVHKIRDEMRFNSLDELKQKITEDVNIAEDMLKNIHPGKLRFD